MSAYEEYECATCAEAFSAYPDANATAGPYCSPVCESEAKDLA
ncbi:hypothetical protein [Halopelagius longus]|uniref:Uncharacterized protein n=1 Tax=Halopelagius longus TaxID=1236180 RepID=A0A1H1FZ28_9EURY|nr:hypothetical protein [Halopelagius longus]SDR05888.1 hypothetical protein SAMN05216278_3396 [Halopelagius longus]